MAQNNAPHETTHTDREEADVVRWQRCTLASAEVNLAWYEAGDGPPLVILHGGVGHDHRLMRTLAAPLTHQYRCILPDQRGSGQSVLPQLDAQSLHIDRFIEDIDVLRILLGIQQVSLVGWSWGASLAFMYGLAHPKQIERLAMISPGPIPYEMLEVYRTNMLRPLTSAERAEVTELEVQSAAPFQGLDAAHFNALFQRRMRIMFRVWFYDPALADRYRPTFLEALDPYRIAQIEPLVYGSLGGFGGWGNMAQLAAPMLVMYGYQDFEPITQADTLREWMPHVQLAWINECGHWPWLEQPAQFYPLLEAFLQH